MFLHLSRIEFFIYFIVYVLFLCYGIYQICMLSDVISSKSKYSGFTNGWKFLNRKRDNLDYEWETWKQFVWSNCLWFLLHLTLTEICRWTKTKLITCVHVAVSVLFLLVHFNLTVLTIILFKNFSFIVLMQLKRKIIIWICAIWWLVLLTFFKYLDQRDDFGKFLNLNEFQCYEFMIVLSWNILKSISFSIDYIANVDEQTSDTFNLVNIFGYVLYFPSLLLGPFMVFGRYNEMRCHTNSSNRTNAKSRHFTLMVDLFRSCFWFLFTDFALHFIYLVNLQNNTEIVKSLNPWSLYTFGYLMGQFFHIKYVVFYGLSIAIAKYENINAPCLPKCISRIHVYSNMWKYFDQGLYEFLFCYIYASLCERTSSMYRKLFANFTTFTFIYVWHGIYQFVLIWSVMNFVCLQLEQVGRYIGRMWQQTFHKYFSETNQNRIKAVYGTQILIPSVISNFYFFAGVEVGNVFIERTYVTGNVMVYLSLSVFLYCIYNVSDVIELWEVERRKMKSIKKCG